VSFNDEAPRREPSRDLVETLSRVFEGVGTFTFDHRWIVLGLSFVLLGICVYLASLTRFDSSFTSYFIADDPIYMSYLDYRDEFGSEEISYLVYEVPSREHGPWDLEIMRTIEGLTAAIEEEVPFVSEGTSLVNMEFMEGVEDGIEIYDLLGGLPGLPQLGPGHLHHLRHLDRDDPRRRPDRGLHPDAGANPDLRALWR
jgi:predicted RND superfamily exporter protein